MTNKNSQKYYIREDILYSSKFEMFELPHQDYTALSIPNQTKNHLVNNKIIINELNKILKNSARKIKLSQKILNFESVKTKIQEEKLKFDKDNKSSKIVFSEPEDDDYEFIERTSQLDLIGSLLEQYKKNPSFDNFENKLKIYLKYIEKEEISKNEQLFEQINEEKKEKKALNQEKEEFMKINVNPIIQEIELLEKGMNNLKLKSDKLEKELEKTQNKPKSKNILKLDKNRLKHVRNTRKIKNLNLEIKILKAQIATLQDDKKMGKRHCPSVLLVFLSLGLIFYTKYSTCKYQILRKKNKINKKKENILKLEKDNFNLEEANEDILKKEIGITRLIAQVEDNTHRKIKKAKAMSLEKEKEIKRYYKKIKQFDSKILKFDRKIKKIEENIKELEKIQKEFEKSSTKEISKIFMQIIEEKEEKINILEELKKDIEKQRIGIKGNWVVEV